MSDAILAMHGIAKAFFGVHALKGVDLDVGRGRVLGVVGQNGAGKSTLMNILGGVVAPDTGEMRLEGQPYQPADPSVAAASGIAFIHQELNLFTNLSIAENIFIAGFPRRRLGPLAAIDRAAVQARTLELLARVGLEMPPDTLVERMSPGERQLVEIAKALQSDARIIIFDEPTTSLTRRETDRLFALIRELKAAGTTMIYISHILADILRLADDIAVLRDGSLVAAGPRDQFDIQHMIALMVGRSLERLYPARTGLPTTEPVLEVRNVSAAGVVKDIDLVVHRGEVLGLFGLMGSGRTELARILFGLDAFDTGDIVVAGKVRHASSPRRSIRDHVAFITEDRREEGMLMSISIADNLALVALPRYGVTPLGFIDRERLARETQQMAGTLGIKARAIDSQPAASLSGGNQ
ncbi:MAG: sugar ABC transporter ATP-binding protein, partial [Candidatus Limnocylindrales bacterium]